jgi:hypothetical protein
MALTVKSVLEKQLLFEGKENTNSVRVKEFSPEGARLGINLKGKITGKIEGFIMSTREILMKPDRTSEVTIRSTNLSNGETVFALEKDTGKIVDPTPTGKIEGNLTFQTPSQNLAYLNQTKGWTEAIYNIATGEYTFKVYTQK